ncbi:hypothetical protein F8388_001492 [Cannabis sativa]|uniref:FAF domain-containing protein n=1 Tax=Cannabis sativa TaxID=3483 RepID=A0A7J6ELW2_CANSA|nr:hypothetical protein G4B88_009143 [Cannabis sativa]KAF4359448.1 hypothetical protein F8388_001492 [Cannabis sativa]
MMMTMATKDFPPPLTTSLIRQTGYLQILLTKRCHFVRRCTNDGKRLVVEEVEKNDDNNYYLRVDRVEGRLVMSIVPINHNKFDDDDQEEDEKPQNICDDF